MPTKKDTTWKVSESKALVVYKSNGKEWRGTKAEAQRIARSLRHLTIDNGPGIFGGRAVMRWEAARGLKSVDRTLPSGGKDPRGKRVPQDYWTIRWTMYI